MHRTMQSPATTNIAELQTRLSTNTSFSTAQLEDQVNKLTAVSYIWGPPGSKSFITINSVEYKVRQNLKHFLRAIRQRYKKSLVVGVYSVVYRDE